MSLTVEQMQTASTDDLIGRLAEIAEAALQSCAHGRRLDAELRKEQARIWQEFADRRQAGRLRMTPKRIRSKVTARHLRVCFAS